MRPPVKDSISSAPRTGSPSITTIGPRTIQMNVQLIPEPFVEIPVELAQELGIKGNDKVKVTSARSFYVAKAFVTKRIRPMNIDGKKVYQIGFPFIRDIAAFRKMRTECADARQPSFADRDRSERIHTRIQGLSGEVGEGVRQ